MQSKKIHLLVLIAVMAAIICVLAPLSLPVGPVPISLASFAVMLAACVLGWKWGTASVVIYLLLGLVGVPVFSGFSAGAAKLIGPTGGYLIGYIPLSLIAGLFAVKFRRHPLWLAVGMVAGTIILYAMGTAWLALQMHMTFGKALGAGVIPFIPGDAVKIVITAVVTPVLYQALVKAGMLQPEA